MSDYTILVSGHSAEWRRNLMAAFKQNGYEKAFVEGEKELMESVREIYPDVLLRRVETQGEALNLIKELKGVSPFSIAVLIVDNPDYFDIFELINAGMMGCLPTRLRPRQIVAAVELIVAAGVICTPRMNPRFLDEHQSDHSELFLSLTSREREILVLLGENKSNQEMADELYLSVSTVKTHLRSIFRKLGLRSRRDAQSILREMGYNDKNDKRLKMNKNIDAAAKLHIIK